MPENVKTGTGQENFSLHSVHDCQKDGRKKFEMFPVKCSNGSLASGEELPFVERPEDHGKRILFFFRKENFPY